MRKGFEVKSKHFLMILKKEQIFYLDALESCDEPWYSHYITILHELSDLVEAIEEMHKEDE